MTSGFLIRLFLFVVLVFSVFACAKRGRPEGGPKDLEPPKFVNSSPENYTINYDQEEITINFNEYIKLEDAQQQIFFSPPIEPRPEIYPMGLPSKNIQVKIPRDSLADNTTYTVNFGKSIQDNTEGNQLPYFKYVFSTGDYVDSLNVEGNIFDAYNRQPDENMSVLLYKMDSTYTDSLVYKEKPLYVGFVRDSTTLFNVENIKAGKYKMIALSDKNNNYKYDPKQDKIGFVERPIEVPTNELFDILVFKEILDFSGKRPKQITRHHFEFGYEGLLEDYDIELLSEAPEDFKFKYFKDRETDTVHYWYKPYLENDSLLFAFRNKEKIDTVEIRPKMIEEDSLRISEVQPKRNLFVENFKVGANTPIVNFKKEAMQLMDKDSTLMDFEVNLDTLKNQLVFQFEKEESQTYNLEFFPGAVTDFFDAENDTLKFSPKTKAYSDYGNYSITITNIEEFPVIVELVDEQNKAISSVYETEKSTFEFKHIKPGEYYIRLIYDQNENGKWDTGNFLKGIKPEPVLYEAKPITVRANWDEQLTITLF